MRKRPVQKFKSKNHYTKEFLTTSESHINGDQLGCKLSGIGLEDIPVSENLDFWKETTDDRKHRTDREIGN